MPEDTSLGALWATLYANGTIGGLALLGLLVIAIVFAAQMEALYTACRHLMVHRSQAISAQQKIEMDVEIVRRTAEEIGASLPDLRAEVEALTREYEALSGQATEARQLHIREVVLSDIFVQPADRPFIATISRPKAEPDEPLAAQWHAGRDHVLYAADQKSGATRFAQRFPADRGFVVGPVSPFAIPWNPPDELSTLEAAGAGAR
ncbi:MAG TPA: hypothetical protein VKQ29_05200 [Aliidongia sp.]|nr:hypothetical protein [Aliidongia sp.]